MTEAGRATTVAQEVLLVPRTVYVPYVAQAPTTTMRMATSSGSASGVVTANRNIVETGGAVTQSAGQADMAALYEQLNLLRQKLAEYEQRAGMAQPPAPCGPPRGGVTIVPGGPDICTPPGGGTPGGPMPPGPPAPPSPGGIIVPPVPPGPIAPTPLPTPPAPGVIVPPVGPGPSPLPPKGPGVIVPPTPPTPRQEALPMPMPLDRK